VHHPGGLVGASPDGACGRAGAHPPPPPPPHTHTHQPSAQLGHLQPAPA
jgi:hypothetical protein